MAQNNFKKTLVRHEFYPELDNLINFNPSKSHDRIPSLVHKKSIFAPWDWNVHLYIYHRFNRNVGKYTNRPMEHMGDLFNSIVFSKGDLDAKM